MSEGDHGIDSSDVAAHEQPRLLATIERLLTIGATETAGALGEAAQLVAEALGADKADAFLYEPSSETLVAVGTSDTPMGRRQYQIGLHLLPVANGGRTVEVYQTGASYRTGRADEDAEIVRGITQGLGVRSLVMARIEVGGEPRGVFAVASAQVEAFSVEDLRFCEAVARWVGLVTQRAELVERITRQAAEQARRVAADKLIEILAHDLRTPLAPARGYLDLLRKRALADGRGQDVRYADQVALAHARLRRMIDVLLDAGRLEQGLFTLELRPVDLAALVQETVETLRTPEAALTVQGPRELVVERVDPERVRQALENLIGNALAHAPEGTPVVVEVVEEQRDEGAWAVLSVRDEGPGIARDLLPTLFDRFARGSASTGLGLGLYLARGIVEAHGGTLTVDAQLSKGTTFRLALPVSAPQR